MLAPAPSDRDDGVERPLGRRAIESALFGRESPRGNRVSLIGCVGRADRAMMTESEHPVSPVKAGRTGGHDRASDLQGRFERPLIVAAALVVPGVVLDAGHFGPGWSALGLALNWGTWLAFVAELVVLLWVTSDRRRWVREHPVEVVATLLSPPLLPGPLQSMRVLRLLRLLRLVRAAQIVRRLTSPAGVRDAALLTMLVVLAGGVGFSDVESSQHLSAWDGVWWATSTITTVGYGDVTPATTAGRLIAIVVMIAGIGFVALLTASIAQRFVAHQVTDEPGPESQDHEILREIRALHRRLDRLERLRLQPVLEGDDP